MGFTIGIGGGQQATVDEPRRDSFPDNLNGGVQFSLAHMIYKGTEIMGGALGAFIAGLGVQFLERIEPSLVTYARPLIDMILEIEDLDPHIQTFFEQLREPAHEGATAILSGLGSQVGGAIAGSFLSSMLAGATYWANRANRPALPSLSDTIDMMRRGVSLDVTPEYILQSLGYHDFYIEAYKEITLKRASESEMLENYKRGHITRPEVIGEMHKRGISEEAIKIFFENIEPLLDARQLLTAYHRGFITKLEVENIFLDWRYSGKNVKLLFDLSKPIPGPSDLVSMAVREAWRDDIAEQWRYDEDRPPDFDKYMAKHGLDPEWAKWYWRAHWALPSVTQGFEMLHRIEGFGEEIDDLLRALDIPAHWRERLKEISYKPYTRVDVRRMYGLGVLLRKDVKRSYLDLGYDDVHAENMTEFTVRYEDAKGEDKSAEYRELTRSVVTQALLKGILDEGEATTRLLGLGYTQEDIDLMLALTRWTKEIAETPDYEADYRKDVRSIIEKGYARRLISQPEAKKGLVSLKYGEMEADYILSSIDFWFGFEQLNAQLKTVGDAYVSRGLNRSDAVERLGAFGIPSEMSSQVLATWDIERNTRSRRLTEAQYRKAVKEMVIGVPEYQENLRGLGYTEYDIWVLTAIMVGIDDAPPPPQSGPMVLGDRKVGA